MKSYQRSIAVMSIVAGFGISGMSMAQENTHSGQDAQQQPRALQDNAKMDTNPNNNLGNKGNATGNNTPGNVVGEGEVAMLRQLAENPEMAPEKLFALDAAMGNLYEIEFSRLVAEKSQDPAIKKCAQMMIKDHQMAQEKLMAIAPKLNIQLPSSLPASKQAKLEVFRALPVEKLEMCFLLNSKAAHLMAVSSYADHAKALQHPELKAYASDCLPKLRAHTAELISLAKAKGYPTDLNFDSQQSMNH